VVCNRWTVVPRNSTVNNDFPKESSFNGRNFVYYFWGEFWGNIRVKCAEGIGKRQSVNSIALLKCLIMRCVMSSSYSKRRYDEDDDDDAFSCLTSHTIHLMKTPTIIHDRTKSY